MLIPRRMLSCGLVLIVGALGGWVVYGQEAEPQTSVATKLSEPAKETGSSDSVVRHSLEEARNRAELMHDIYLATLDSMHRRYFHGERAIVPARVMEDIFSRIEKQHQLQARWISASLSPMSINHEPKTPFEKQAAQKIAKGDEVVETIEDGYYRRAGSVALSGGCVSCHAGLFATTSTTPKFAGLILSIPVTAESKLPATK
ncbi:MAG: DUF3365 domain-containing protein [Planctomycetaceae bacterium]|nr:DUF3365 domain-containing protein [Planctomycetaceae bacterium]